jgi:hypothetical protein
MVGLRVITISVGLKKLAIGLDNKQRGPWGRLSNSVKATQHKMLKRL